MLLIAPVTFLVCERLALPAAFWQFTRYGLVVAVVTIALLFLAAGFVLGDGVLGVVSVQPGDELVGTLAELALFAVLFTDGMRVGWRELRSAWRLPGRALG
ncbi:hypothetical protein ACTWPT_36035 [Nonomuraea sp. 3N208]|uniref:hypothetical protein n=1 Tax=Nonomuraea sp. 3N208 TaxID=3457421 RepID=UPI003FD20736